MLCFRRVPKYKPLTRRGLLSIVSSIYDPLGLICPCTVVAKKIVQALCAQNLAWDEPLPDQQLSEWLSWVRDIECIEEVKLDRWMLPEHFGDLISCQLHHFSDASNTAYGAASYLRCVNSFWQIRSGLLFAKSRLAPLKRVTTPRLELMASTLAVKLDRKLRDELDIHVHHS